jgi:hypothetical protein
MTQENNPQQPSTKHWLDNIPWRVAPLAILLALLPFKPEPHLLEKINMLFTGSLTRPIDIFDFFMHGTPLLIFLLKTVRHFLGFRS